MHDSLVSKLGKLGKSEVDQVWPPNSQAGQEGQDQVTKFEVPKREKQDDFPGIHDMEVEQLQIHKQDKWESSGFSTTKNITRALQTLELEWTRRGRTLVTKRVDMDMMNNYKNSGRTGRLSSI